ncbi:MAG: hypothetical protein IJK23_00490 [Clostridia bacterium]|nr:hypothetical protein [Clostridia bacterium]
MDKKYKKILKDFQSDGNRSAEEDFARTLSENNLARLFFINENEAFTDGVNIVVDPAKDELYADRSALDRIGAYLGWPAVTLADPWNALSIITRAQTIHECLHLLYSDFPGRQTSDPKCDTKNKKRVMGMISNIIEDAYIEAAGCSVYDHMEFYLRFGRVARLFANNPSEGTVAKTLGDLAGDPTSSDENESDAETKKTNARLLLDFLNYMGTFLLYPMVIQNDPDSGFAEYVRDTKQLFLDGSIAPSPEARYGYASRIFDRIAHLIPDDTEPLPEQPLRKLLGGVKTHEGGAALPSDPRKGRMQTVTARLFTALDGGKKPDAVPTEQLMRAVREFAQRKDTALKQESYNGTYISIPASEYDCSVLHKDIRINESRPKINFNLQKAYRNIYNQYRSVIHSYNRRFSRLLNVDPPQREEKQLFGSAVSSRYLGDPKKRYWYRDLPERDVPDIAVLLLIDGSGSMSGERRTAAMHAAVILHEVLSAQGIAHAVAEHRTVFDAPEIDVNVLIGFHGRKEEKLNLMQLDAYGENRDGLALFWAERYIGRNAQNDERLIIVLSDGAPAHGIDGYYPPVSVRDTADAVRKITKRGTNIIGISLDLPGEFDCYDSLADIYPNLVGCSDLDRLTGQILSVVAKMLK